MNYDSYSYLYPPRPEAKIPSQMLGFYEKRGWEAQIKKNGTCTVVFARGDEVIFKTRHADDHKMWSPLPEHREFFKGRSDKWNVFAGELLHSKTPHIKNQLYLFDQIVKDGVQLVGTTFAERQAILANSFGDGDLEAHCHRVDKYVARARNFTGSFLELYNSLTQIEDEGLVVKNPKAILKPCFKSDSNATWQVKSRVTHKNYGF